MPKFAYRKVMSIWLLIFLALLILLLISLWWKDRTEVKPEMALEELLTLGDAKYLLTPRNKKIVDDMRKNFKNYRGLIEREIKPVKDLRQYTTQDAKQRYETMQHILMQINTKEAGDMILLGMAEQAAYLDLEWQRLDDFEKGREKSISPVVNSMLVLYRNNFSILLSMKDFRYTNDAWELLEKVDSATRRVILRYLIEDPNNADSVAYLSDKWNDPKSRLYKDVTVKRYLDYFEQRKEK